MATVTVSGPLFDGRDEAYLDAMCDEIARGVAEQGQRYVLGFTAASFKTRTPYYETQIDTHALGGGRAKVDDGGVVYGPWLEGVGSRNSPVTRFRGYFSFRKATQMLDANAQRIAERLAGPWIGRM